MSKRHARAMTMALLLTLTVTTKAFSSEPSDQLLPGRWYIVGKSVTLPVFEDKLRAPNSNIGHLRQLTVGLDTEINILETSADGEFAQIGIDDETISQENSGINAEEPVVVWVRVSQLLAGQLEEVNVENSEEFSSQLDRSRGRGGGGMTYCLREVRMAAYRFTRRVPSGIAAAAQAYWPFRQMGWLPVSYSLHAPVGTACFFGHGRWSKGCGGYCGHAAIKLGKNNWKGAGFRPTPFLPGRTLIGCLMPPSR